MKKKIKDLLKDNVIFELVTNIEGGITVIVDNTRIIGEKVFNGRTLKSRKLDKDYLIEMFKILFSNRLGEKILDQEIEVNEND